ncbi:hypothetical protein LTR50_000808 [Elasticomyces elasticus]|nr:hypothetical protein LTR50_000808 [Elasticomyces elasticus]
MFRPSNPGLFALTTICSLLLPTIFAQTSPSPSPSPSTTSAATASSSSSSPSSTATVAPGTSGYSYIGCYNETTGIAGSGGVRALVGGKMEANSTMTPAICLSFCGGSQYAGLEYGRECWCSPYVNSLAAKLEDGSCNIACEGNASQVCGGRLT